MSGALDDSPADIMRQLIEDLSLGADPSGTASWPIYSSREPNDPDDCITLYDTSGDLQDTHQKDGEVQEFHGIQLRIRSSDPATGYAKARALAVALDETILQDCVTLGSNIYAVYSVTRKSGVIPLGKESPTSMRNLFTINAVVRLRQTS
jgi:hypothetical protein